MLEKPRVLIVDDDPNICEMLRDILEMKEYAPVVATSGDEAILRAQEGRFAVVFLDLHLPDRFGTELIPYIREGSPEAEIVIATADSSLESALAGMRAGAGEYIIKPAPPELYLHTMERAMEKVRLKGESARAQKLQAINELAGAAAHTINQPLTAIIGFTQMRLREIAEDDPNREIFSVIEEQALEIADIVRKIDRITDYQTKKYSRDTDILDIERSTANKSGDGRE